MSFLQLLPSSSFEFYGEDGCVFDLLGSARFF